MKSLLFAIAVFSLGMTLSGGHTDFYVSPSGFDSNAGTKAAPFKTIQKAANAVAAGDVVHVASGTYIEKIICSKSGTASARIRFVSDTRWGAKVIPLLASTASSLWTVDGDYVDVEGFEISGEGSPLMRVGLSVRGNYDRIYRNHVHNFKAQGETGSGGGGIVMNAGGNYHGEGGGEVFENVVHDMGYFGGGYSSRVHGIYMSSPNLKTYNNITYRNQSFGIHLNHNPQNNIVANNLSFANEDGGFYLGDASGSIIVNNISYDNLNDSGFNTDFHEARSTNLTFIGNLAFNNPGKQSTHASVKADPKFVKYMADGTGDYHLTAGSPAINKGTASNAPSTDYDRIKRPQGAGYDIGPYEYTRHLRKKDIKMVN